MTDVVFRTKVAPPTPQEGDTVMKAPKDKSVPRGLTDVEPPFTDYESVNNKPFLVDFYELGSMWDQGDMYSHGYVDEVKDINQYLNYAIEQGEVNNTLDSVKNEIKRIEKMIDVDKNDRKSMRLAMVAEYAKFLLKSHNIKKETARRSMI